MTHFRSRLVFTSVHTYPVLRGVYACHFHPTLTCGVTEIWHLRCQLYLPAGALSPLLYPAGDTKVRRPRCQLYPISRVMIPPFTLPGWHMEHPSATPIWYPALVRGVSYFTPLGMADALWHFVAAGYRPAQISDRGKVRGTRIAYSPTRYKEISNIRFSWGENA